MNQTALTLQKRIKALTLVAIVCLVVGIGGLGASAMAQELPALPQQLPDFSSQPAPQLNSAPAAPTGHSLPSLPSASATNPTATAPGAANLGSASVTATSAPRFYDEGGVRYRETTVTVREPVQDVQYQTVPQLGYEQRLRTDLQTVNYYTQVPSTQYECVPRLYDWWRVFRGGYVAYGLEPYTTWQTQPQSTTVPVTTRETRPVTRAVKVAVPNLRFVERQRTTRVAVGPAGSTTAAESNSDPTLTPSYRAPIAVANNFNYSAPRYVPPRASVPIYSSPNYSAPRESIPRYSAPRYSAPRDSVPRYSAPQYSAPRYVSPIGIETAQARDPNPFGGWSVASGPETNVRQSNVQPNVPISSLPANAGDATQRYGGVARYDGAAPRYGAGSTLR